MTDLLPDAAAIARALLRWGRALGKRIRQIARIIILAPDRPPPPPPPPPPAPDDQDQPPT